MTKHRRHRSLSRTLQLIVLAVAGSVCWRRRSLSQLRRELGALRQRNVPELLDVSELLDTYGRDRQPPRHRHVAEQPAEPDRPALSAQATMAGRWAESPGPVVRRLHDLAGEVRSRRSEWAWPVIQMAAAAVIVLPLVVVPDVVGGRELPPSTARTAAADSGDFRHGDGGLPRGIPAPAPGEDDGGGEQAATAEDAHESDGERASAEKAEKPKATGVSDGPKREQPKRKNPPVQVAPYLFLAGSRIPDAGVVMQRTGVTAFTLAFILSDGGCRPVWTGDRPLNHPIANAVTKIQAAGGEAVVSFGGWSGHKLGLRCPNPRALAGAYQRVIDAYGLSAIDIDIERHEFESARAQDRVLRALKIVEATNPDLTTIVTMPVTRDGLNSWGRRMVRRSAELGAPVDVWTIMPFVLGQRGGNMGKLTIRAAERTRLQIARAHPGISPRQVYGKLGISTMNGNTGAGETITQANFREIRDYVDNRGLARFTFWAVNRDRSCLLKGHRPCSGIRQHDWQFTKIVTASANNNR